MLFNILPTILEIGFVAAILLVKYDPWFCIVTLATLVVYVVFTLLITEWRMIFRRNMNEMDSKANAFNRIIQRSREQTFQILARTATVGDADEGAIRASARSFRSLADPARRTPQPDRVAIVTVVQPGPFESGITKFGPLAIDVAEESLLNNVDPGENVLKGQALKIVRPGSKR